MGHELRGSRRASSSAGGYADYDVVAFANSQSLLFDSGEWVLVTAAAGGIGMSAVQIAKGTYRNPRVPTEALH